MAGFHCQRYALLALLALAQWHQGGAHHVHPPDCPPTISPAPTDSPEPSPSPSEFPTDTQSPSVSLYPSSTPTNYPTTSEPSDRPSPSPTESPEPSPSPSEFPSFTPSASSMPSDQPTVSTQPSALPSSQPSASPSDSPSLSPSTSPSANPTVSSMPSAVPSSTPTSSPSVSFQPSSSMIPSAEPSMDPTSSAMYHTAETSITLTEVPGLMDKETAAVFEQTTLQFLSQEFPVPEDLESIEFMDIQVLEQTLVTGSGRKLEDDGSGGSSSLKDISIRMKVVAVLWRGDPKVFRLEDGLKQYFENGENIGKLRNRLDELSMFFGELSVGRTQRNSQPLSKLGNENNKGFPVAAIGAMAGVLIAVTAALVLFTWKKGRSATSHTKQDAELDLENPPTKDSQFPSFDDSEDTTEDESRYPLGIRRPRYSKGVYYPTNHIESVRTVDPLEKGSLRLFQVENNIEVPETPANETVAAIAPKCFDEEIVPVPSTGSKTHAAGCTKPCTNEVKGMFRFWGKPPRHQQNKNDDDEGKPPLMSAKNHAKFYRFDVNGNHRGKHRENANSSSSPQHQTYRYDLSEDDGESILATPIVASPIPLDDGTAFMAPTTTDESTNASAIVLEEEEKPSVGVIDDSCFAINPCKQDRTLTEKEEPSALSIEQPVPLVGRDPTGILGHDSAKPVKVTRKVRKKSNGYISPSSSEEVEELNGDRLEI